MRTAISIALALIVAAGIGLMTASPSLSQDPQQSPSASNPITPPPIAAAQRPDSAAPPKLSRRASAAHPADASADSQTRLAPLQGAPIPPDALEAFVDGAVAQAMSRDHLAGVTVAVVQNGQVILKKGYGFAGPGRPVDPDRTLFRVGSITSTFTWIALMKEAEAGRIRLDAPVNLFLPEKLQVRDQGFKRQILVRDLMTHSTGFEDRTLGQLFEEDPAQVRPLFEYLRQERPRRVREPGGTPSLSNYGAALAGAAITYVNGHPYQDIVEGEILRPLGLAHTSLREPYPASPDLPAPMPGTLAADLASGYRWRDGGFQAQPFEYATHIAPAAGASSSAGDMARYMNLILAGGQLDGVTLYDAATDKGFHTTTLAAAPGVNGWDDGFQEFSLPGGYRGQGLMGDTLWFHASLVTAQALNLGIFIATNTDTGAGLAASLPGQIVGRFYAQPQIEPRAGSAALAANADAYEGTYLTTRRPYDGLGKFVFMLTGQLKIRVTPDGRLLTRGAGQTQTWTAAGAPDLLAATQGPQVSAFAMADGQAQRWFAPSGATAFDRIGPAFQIPTLAGLAALTALASLATLFGQFTRDPREFRQTGSQARASLLQTTVAVLWLIVFGAFGLWLVGVRDIERLMYHWPGGLLLVASTCAFVAAVLTALTLVMTPMIWRGGRRLDSWSGWRKLQFTTTTALFAAFSVILGLWGALEPWSR